jgi:hypothetical protein
MRNEFNQSIRKMCELSLGPLRWRFISTRETKEAVVVITFDVVSARGRALIDQALCDGCTRAEVNAILGQILNGDHHADA